jgi:hypothetical protein
MQQIMRIWCDYTGETLDPEAGINIAGTIYDRPMEAADVGQMTGLVDGLLMSRKSAIKELQRGGVNRSTNSPEDEMKQIEKEQKEAAALSAMLPPGPEPDPTSQMDNSDLPSSGDQPQRPGAAAAAAGVKAPAPGEPQGRNGRPSRSTATA